MQRQSETGVTQIGNSFNHTSVDGLPRACGTIIDLCNKLSLSNSPTSSGGEELPVSAPPYQPESPKPTSPQSEINILYVIYFILSLHFFLSFPFIL